CINLSRHAGVDAEQSLRKANLKFERRFRELENKASGKGFQVNEMTTDELEQFWCKVKSEEK
ncbi:MAG: nucleoside triphosphate pyrophosphohydrolase, partial [Gammaproteobacteria bacterium]|nr:nucleoside triphosphate pyrophosphohydrolase [Gammaproteobacteria bacterium]